MIYTHTDETNKEISAQVVIAKFELTNQFREREKVVATR